MQKHDANFYSLSRRIVLQFCMFSLIISAVYGMISFVLMYTLEDSFIEKDILREAAYLSNEFNKSDIWPDARSPNMQVHFSKSTFPDDIRDVAIDEPQRKEFYGQQGRHYHLHQFIDHPGVFLVAEVSSQLLVRPIREGVIKFLVVSGILVTTIACLIAWFIGRKTTKPLKQLAELVGGVAPEQLPDKFAAQFPHNEVGILAITLEQTLAKISSALLREKNFTRDVSHELRTPLAVIKNAVELSRSQGGSSQSDLAVLTRIYDAADQMEKTVHTLLMLAREEHANIDNTATALMPVIEKAILDNRMLLDDKHIDIDISDSCNVKVNADGSMLKVVLDNILSNAFKYTDAGQVSIAFANDRLSIQDTGPGIEPAISEHVTEAGIKGHQSTGFGFGLSIVKRLCEHQGWTMQVESSNGTTVTVLFPR